MTDGLRVETADGVATLTLDRPARKNALTFELYAALRDWFEAAGSDPAIRAIVHDAARNDYRFSSLILGVAKSTPFQMRRSQEKGD